jgi:RNA polymerase sigma factor (sigma-70 family)
MGAGIDSRWRASGTRQMAKELSDRIERLFSLRRSHLKTFFGRRVRERDDIADLTQEAFLRVLRADSSQAIHNPEAYLFAVAGNLAREYSVLSNRFRAATDAADPSIENELSSWPDMDTELNASQRCHALHSVLNELSPKCRAAVVMQYRDGLTYQDIGERLGVSANMVKKYLSKALAHCRQRLAEEKDLL